MLKHFILTMFAFALVMGGDNFVAKADSRDAVVGGLVGLGVGVIIGDALNDEKPKRKPKPKTRTKVIEKETVIIERDRRYPAPPPRQRRTVIEEYDDYGYDPYYERPSRREYYREDYRY